MGRKFTFLNLTIKPTPDFVKKLCSGFSKSICGEGNLHCQFSKSNDGYEVLISPSVREIYGGSNDGERLFGGFAFDICRFTKVFDKSPKYIFDCLNKRVVEHFLFEGFIKENKVRVAILISPPDNQSSTEKICASGPLSGKVIHEDKKENKYG